MESRLKIRKLSIMFIAISVFFVFGCSNEPKPAPPDPPTPVVYTPTVIEVGANIGDTFEFTYVGENLLVDWGDGTIDHETKHEYYVESAGSTLVITISGEIESISFCDNQGVPLEDNENIKTIAFGEGISIIDKFALANLNVTSVILPNSLMTIGEEAFLDCDKLGNIVIPKSVNHIKQHAFYYSKYGDKGRVYYCEAESQPYGWDNEWYGGNSRECHQLCWGHISHGVDGYYGYVVTKKGAFVQSYNNSGDSSINIPDVLGGYPVVGICSLTFFNHMELNYIKLPQNIQTICDYAFQECEYLREMTIPSTVTEMGKAVFMFDDEAVIYCLSESKPIGWDNDWCKGCYIYFWGYISQGEKGDFGYVLTKHGVEIALYTGAGEGEEVTIPSDIAGVNVTVISKKSFENKEITSIKMPKFLNRVGESAFYYSYGLTIIDLSELNTGLVPVCEDAFNKTQTSVMNIYIKNEQMESRLKSNGWPLDATYLVKQ